MNKIQEILINSEFKKLLTGNHYMAFKIEFKPSFHERWGYHVALSKDPFDRRFNHFFFEVTKDTYIKYYDECYCYISKDIYVDRIKEYFVSEERIIDNINKNQNDDIFMIGTTLESYNRIRKEDSKFYEGSCNYCYYGVY